MADPALESITVTGDEDIVGPEQHARAVFLSGIRLLVRPLARIAMRHGLCYSDFERSIKLAFLESAEKDFLEPDEDLDPGEVGMTVRGKSFTAAVPVEFRTPSQISILSGVSELEARRLYETTAHRTAEEELLYLNRIVRLIQAWTEYFSGPFGIPLELPLTGEGKTFPDLVKSHGLGLPPDELLKEIIGAGVAKLVADGSKVRLLNKAFVSGKVRPENLERMCRTIHSLVETLDHNLSPSREKPPLFERRVFSSDPLDRWMLEEFKGLITEEGQSFLEKLDEWFGDKISEKQKKRAQGYVTALQEPGLRKVGVCVFEYHIDAPEEIKNDHMEEIRTF